MEKSDEGLYDYLRTLMDSHDHEVCSYTETTDDEPYNWTQNWYECHTCELVSDLGICSVCARICHKDHNVTYGSRSLGYCDCDDETCQTYGPVVFDRDLVEMRQDNEEYVSFGTDLIEGRGNLYNDSEPDDEGVYEN